MARPKNIRNDICDKQEKQYARITAQAIDKIKQLHGHAELSKAHREVIREILTFYYNLNYVLPCHLKTLDGMLAYLELMKIKKKP